MKRLALATAALALLAVPALADPPAGRGHRGNSHDGEWSADRDGRSSRPDMGAVVIGAVERALIREYFQDHPAMVGGGDNLPPGIRKNLARGKPMPPGIAKKMPGDLYARLPPRPGYDYRVVGADVLLVEVATGVIVDLVRDILR